MAAILYFALSDLTPPVTILQCTLVLVATVFVGLILAAIWHLVRSHYGHVYGFLPTPRDLEEYRGKLVDHYSRATASPPGDIDKQVLDYIHTAFIEGAHQNALNNDHRSACLHRAKRMLVIAVLFFVLLILLKVATTPAVASWALDLPNLPTRGFFQ
jgi:hypothetical protein